MEPGEDFHEGAARELYEETGLKLEPIKVAEAFEEPYFTTIGMTDESCAPSMATPVARLAQQPRKTAKKSKLSSPTEMKYEES